MLRWENTKSRFPIKPRCRAYPLISGYFFPNFFLFIFFPLHLIICFSFFSAFFWKRKNRIKQGYMGFFFLLLGVLLTHVMKPHSYHELLQTFSIVYHSWKPVFSSFLSMHQNVLLKNYSVSLLHVPLQILLFASPEKRDYGF